MVSQIQITLPSFRRGFHLIDKLVLEKLPPLPEKGLLNLFIKHTSAALSINENADPTVRKDFELVSNKIVPENIPGILHDMEGPDDMPAHVKSSLYGQSLTIPITNGRLNLGTWQGIYLCEFRDKAPCRKIVLTILS